jgi:DNA-binding transcriptional MerR regulator
VARRRTEKLYSLAEVAAKTGISVASLRRYRAEYPERVPSVGEGRRQRFPEAALPAFRELKQEGMARRGRRRTTGVGAGAPAEVAAPQRAAKRRAPKGTASKRRLRTPRKTRGRRAAAAAGADREGLLTLVEIGRRTGISYPTLLRYVRLYLDRLPHTGSGRKRRFRPAAVDEFRKLREGSRRGRGAARDSAAGAAITRQLAKLERGQLTLAGQLRDLRKALARPIRIKLY